MDYLACQVGSQLPTVAAPTIGLQSAGGPGSEAVGLFVRASDLRFGSLSWIRRKKGVLFFGFALQHSVMLFWAAWLSR